MPGILHRLLNPIWPPGLSKRLTGSGKLPNPRLLDPAINFCKIFDSNIPFVKPKKSKMAVRGPQNGQEGLQRGPLNFG